MTKYHETTWEKLGLEVQDPTSGRWYGVSDRDVEYLQAARAEGSVIPCLRYVNPEPSNHNAACTDEVLAILWQAEGVLADAIGYEGKVNGAGGLAVLEEIWTQLNKGCWGKKTSDKNVEWLRENYGPDAKLPTHAWAAIDTDVKPPGNLDAYSYDTAGNRREHAAALHDTEWLNELISLTRENSELRAELIGVLTEVVELGGYQHIGGEYDGWWSCRCRPRVKAAGERLVELGAWERHPQGHWYRPKQEASR